MSLGVPGLKPEVPEAKVVSKLYQLIGPLVLGGWAPRVGIRSFPFGMAYFQVLC